MKRFFAFTLISLLAFSLYSLQFSKKIHFLKDSYAVELSLTDAGEKVNKLIVKTSIPVAEKNLDSEDFEVNVLIFPSGSSVGISKGERKVSAAYLCSENGQKISHPSGNFLALELESQVEDKMAGLFTGFTPLDIESVFGFKIENSRLDLKITKCSGYLNELLADVKTSSFTHIDSKFEEQVKIKYAYYKPENIEKKKIPLIVFFHGIGESGQNVYRPLTKIRSSALFDKKIQSHFQDGAAVLIPQCPTGWLEITSTDVSGNRLWVPVDVKKYVAKVLSPVAKFLNGFAANASDFEVEPENSVSFYTETIKALIDNFIKENPDIDLSRIYVGGCSAGGYMTINMMLQFPDFFAAGFPVCPAFPADRLSSKTVNILRKMPVWITLADNDPVIRPETYGKTIFTKLDNSGAENLHHTYFEDVHDVSGITDKDGKPYQYNGHDSWIYLFNDLVYEENLNLFDWLALQRN